MLFFYLVCPCKPPFYHKELLYGIAIDKVHAELREFFKAGRKLRARPRTSTPKKRPIAVVHPMSVPPKKPSRVEPPRQRVSEPQRLRRMESLGLTEMPSNQELAFRLGLM